MWSKTPNSCCAGILHYMFTYLVYMYYYFIQNNLQCIQTYVLLVYVLLESSAIDLYYLCLQSQWSQLYTTILQEMTLEIILLFSYYIYFVIYNICIIFAYTYCNVCPHKNPVDIYFWSFNFLVFHKAGGSSEI